MPPPPLMEMTLSAELPFAKAGDRSLHPRFFEVVRKRVVQKVGIDRVDAFVGLLNRGVTGAQNITVVVGAANQLSLPPPPPLRTSSPPIPYRTS